MAGTKLTIDASDVVDFAKEIQSEAGSLHKNLVGAMTTSALQIQTTAKKPGYAPIKTGNLRRSITHRVKTAGATISAIIGSNLIYAAIHEFGGQTGRNGSVNIRKKRYIQRAIEDNTNSIRERLGRAIKAGIIK